MSEISFEELEKGPAAKAAPAAAEVSFDDLEKGAAPAAPSGEISFDDLEKKATVSNVNRLIPGAPGGPPIFPSTEEIKQSPVGHVMEALNVPTKVVTGGVIRALDATVAPGIQQALNPEKALVPDAVYSDVLNYMTPSAKDVEAYFQKNGFGPISSAAVRESYRLSRAGLGIATNVLGDPLFWLGPKIGGLTAESEAAYKAGNFDAKMERNIVSFQPPGAKQPILEVPAAPVADKIALVKNKAVAAIESTPAGAAALDQAGKAVEFAGKVKDNIIDFARSLLPETGSLEIDVARSVHSAKARASAELRDAQAQWFAEKQFTDGEKAVLRGAIETTPNVAPEALAEESAKFPKIGAHPDVVRPQVAARIEQVAKERGVELAPGRADDLAEAAMKVKEISAQWLGDRVSRGIIPREYAQHYVIENYLVHEISAEGRAFLEKDPERAAVIEEMKEERRFKAAVAQNPISAYDPGKKARFNEGLIDEVNARMKEKHGVDKFFIDDPIAATLLKAAQHDKFMRDIELLEKISKYGIRPATPAMARQLRSRGYLTIDHPLFEGKTIVLGEGKKAVTVKVSDVYFPHEIATKVGYDIVRRDSGLVNAFLDSYNRVFRGFALARPDYYLENWIDNLLKNFVHGVKIEDYVDAMRALNEGKGTIKINGSLVPIEDVRRIMEKLSVKSGGHFSEGFEGVLYTGKKITGERTLMARGRAAITKTGDWVSSIFKGVHAVGERGENLTRVALFLNRLKQGYTPEMAVFEVEKWLFDFRRTTPVMDTARRFYAPFIQAALKTARIAPGLVATKPYVWNAYENNLMRVLGSAFHDPVTSKELGELFPDYYRMHDRVAGPLLPANQWLAIMAPKYAGLPQVVALGLPGGLGILNQFAVWDNQVWKQNAGGSPVLRALGIMITGKDPWTDQDIDISKRSADVSRRFQVAINRFASGAVAMPNMEKWLQQKFGFSNPDLIEPASVLALHGSLSKFGRVTNLDREFFIRMVALASAKKELTTKLMAELRKEASGQTLDSVFADSSLLRKGASLSGIRPYTSTEVFERLTGEMAKGQKAMAAAQAIRGSIGPAELVAMLKNIEQSTKELNRSYQVLTEQYLKLAVDQRRARIQLIQNQLSGVPAPQITPTESE